MYSFNTFHLLTLANDTGNSFTRMREGVAGVIPAWILMAVLACFAKMVLWHPVYIAIGAVGGGMCSARAGSADPTTRITVAIFTIAHPAIGVMERGCFIGMAGCA